MAKDFYHEHVKAALKASGWTITHDPYRLNVGGLNYSVDIGAEQLFAAERGADKIAVEVKSFLSPSNVNEFHRTIGQFIDYSIALELQEQDRTLFVAVPMKAWKTFFQEEIVQITLRRTKIRIMIYDPESKKVIEWKSY